MRYYIVDNQGNVYGDTVDLEKAKAMYSDTVNQLLQDHTKNEVAELDLEVIDDSDTFYEDMETINNF